MDAPFSQSDKISRLVQRRERNPRTHTFAELADLYRQTGELSRALEVIEDGLRHHPHFLNARLVYARLLRELGRPDEAAQAFELVLEIDSQNEVAREALSELGRTISSIAPSRPAAREGGPAAAQWLAKLDADWHNGSTTEPVSAGDEKAEKDERDEKDDKKDEAPQPMARPAGERRSGDDLETATLAELYVSQGLVEQAIGIYERLLARDPYNARLAAALEDVRHRGKRPAGASKPARPPRPAEPEAADIPDTAPVLAAGRTLADEEERRADDDAEEHADDMPVGEFLQALLEGRAPVEQEADRPIDWPQWLKDLGTRS